MAVSFSLTSTFYMIFIAEAVGGGDFISGMHIVGSLIALGLAVQLLFDYPTGGLGDHIGQKYVISLAYICYGVTYLMVSLVTTSTPFWWLVAIYVLRGIGIAQQSGALMAWFDNNYRAAAPDDNERRRYGVFMGKAAMILQVVSTVVLIPGGLLAMSLGRPWVFQLQALICILVAGMSIVLLNDLPEVKATKSKTSVSEYFSVLKEGVRFLWSDPFVTYFLLGGMLAFAVVITWGSLLLFPFYYVYLITDVAVAIFRTVIFIPHIPANERSGVWTEKLDPKKWIPRFRLGELTSFGFFSLLGGIMLLSPPPTANTLLLEIRIPLTELMILQIPESSVLPIILMIVVFTIGSFCWAFRTVLSQRILLDVIPDRIRNSVYSLQPSVANIFALLMIVVFGWILSNFGFPVTLLCLAFIALIALLLIRKGLTYPIPVLNEPDISVEDV
jgi:MFS family permease